MASMAQFVLRVRGPTGEKENLNIIDPYAFPNAFYCSNYNSNITKPTCTKNTTNGKHHNQIYILHTHKRPTSFHNQKKYSHQPHLHHFITNVDDSKNLSYRKTN